MFEWFTIFKTVGKMEKFPVLLNMAVASSTAGYFHRGIDRQHDRYCAFQYTLSGEGFIEYKGKRFTVKAGQAMLFQAYNKEVTYGFPENAREPWRFIYIDIANIDDFVEELLQQFGPVFNVPKESRPVKKLMNYYHSQNNSHLIDAFEGAEFAFNLLSELGHYARTNQTYGADKQIKEADRLIEAHLSTGINTTDLAKMMKISREHLSRLFKQRTGLTLHEYISRKRILKACQLLKDSNLSCKEISFAVGDSSPTHFNAFFKKHLNMTPRKYREIGSLPNFL